ncbi:MAG: RNA polymerase sigma factor [Clostridia bacterium]|nr:RNA polymerase sigma factor [Clostridia bacterium]
MTREAMEALVIGMQDALYRVSAAILYRPCDREDAIQECILKAIQKRDSLRDDRAAKSWIMRILINECYKILRFDMRVRPSDLLPEPEPAPDADRNVFRILFSLPDAFRLPTVLFYVEGYTVEEIGKMLRLPSGTVKSRLSRARKKMKEELTKEASEK